jgi:hypothetical protein
MSITPFFDFRQEHPPHWAHQKVGHTLEGLVKLTLAAGMREFLTLFVVWLLRQSVTESMQI